MLFAEEDAPSLKTWIVKRIENTSDADADVLAEYVIALLRHDGDLKSVRELCEKEIPDFLTEDSRAFLDDVFEAIAYKSYRPGAAPPPSKRAGPAQSAPQPTPVQSTNSQQSGSRKRGYDDFGDTTITEAKLHPGENGRVTKQPRRNNQQDQRHGGSQGGFVQNMGHVPPFPQLPPFDPNNPMGAMLQMQAMGLLPPFQAPQAMRGGRNQGKRRGRCRDFDRKGYCSRGVNCKYDHGNEIPFVPPPVDVLDYDNDSNDVGIVLSNPNMQQNYFPMDSQSTQNGREKRKARGNRKTGGRAPFSADGPVTDKSKTSIVVESIPEDHFSEDAVRAFFSKFGEIQEISMQPYKHLAIVKYDSWAAANAAYKSPNPIFDNRFVKVFWYRDASESIPNSMPLNGSHPHGSSYPTEDADPEPEIDMEELARRQEEAQQKFSEREAKRAELDEQRQEIEKKQQELLVQHREATEALQARLSAKNGSTGGGGGAEQLRAQLAALESEAKILGIDPNGIDDTGSMSEYGAGYPPPRGGYRGRARGRGPCGRGRGSFRGAPDRHAAYAQFSLDNRPRKIAIKGADFTVPEQDEKLRQFLLNMGEFDSVDTDSAVAHVSFGDRKTAERAFYSLNGKELSGVEGTLEVSWINTPLPPQVKAPASQPAAAENGGKGGGGGTADDEMEDGEIEGSEEGEAQDDRQDERGEHMDYDAW